MWCYIHTCVVLYTYMYCVINIIVLCYILTCIVLYTGVIWPVTVREAERVGPITAITGSSSSNSSINFAAANPLCPCSKTCNSVLLCREPQLTSQFFRHWKFVKKNYTYYTESYNINITISNDTPMTLLQKRVSLWIRREIKIAPWLHSSSPWNI